MDSLAETYPLVVIVGPTAAGKSALALALAEGLDGEIVNYDSVQVYRGFDIGTGKLPPQERRGIPHHLLDIVEPEQIFTAGDYRHAALRVLANVQERAKLPILVGGTGLYLRALLVGLFEGPARSEELRERLRTLAERRGREFLHRLLRRLDIPASRRIQPRDTQKIIRALEVRVLTRKPLSAIHALGRAGLGGFRIFKIGLNPDRAKLYQRIDWRVDGMFAGGLIDEVRGMLARSEAARIKALGALGYRQACAVIRGELTPPEALRQTQIATRRYAKRQMTWFRREADVAWYEEFGDEPGLQQQVLDRLRPVCTPGLRTGIERPRPAPSSPF